MKLLKTMLIAGFSACLIGGIALGVPTATAGAEETAPSSATTVPQDELKQLDLNGGTLTQTIKSNTTATVRFNADGASDYSLANATDIAFRYKVTYSQVNRPNVGSGLTYVRLKFKDSDTIWGAAKEDLRYTFVDAYTNEVRVTRISDGGDNNVSGQINNDVGTDGTIYIPLTHLRDGNMKADPGNRLTDTADYRNLELEYIEFTYSSSRWNFAFGQAAIIRQSAGTVTTDILQLTAEARNNLTLYTMWQDNVALKVNGHDAVKAADSDRYEVDLGVMGKVYIPSDKLYAFDPVRLKSELAEGYGITAVATSADGYEITQRTEKDDNWGYDKSTPPKFTGRNEDRSSLQHGYVYEGEYFFRKGSHGLHPGGANDLAALGSNPLDFTLEVTVSPLVKADLTGENVPYVDVYYSRINSIYKDVNLLYTYKHFSEITSSKDWRDVPDDGSDGKLYFKPNEDASVVVVPKAGYDFTGLKLGSDELTLDDATEVVRDSEHGNRVTAVVYILNLTENTEMEILGLGEEVTVTYDIAATGGSVTVDNKAITETSTTSNIFKTHAIRVTPAKGYSSTVSVILPASGGGEETLIPLSPATDGVYYYQVEGDFTLEVTFEIVNYNITYRLNNGAYASGESNPATVTYFDTVTLKTPARDGYDFLGWRIEGETGYITELKEVASDLTLIAVFGVHSDPDPDDNPGGDAKPDDGNNGGCGGCGSVLSLGAGSVVLLGAALLAVKKRKNNS